MDETYGWDGVRTAALLQAGLRPKRLRELLAAGVRCETWLQSEEGAALGAIPAVELPADTQAVSLAESAYPPRLKTISAPPGVLYCRSSRRDGLEGVLRAGVGIVGTREMSSYGEAVARTAARAAVAAGVPVWSGLALGVDACAHEETLAAGGQGVAVIASSVDNLTPRRNAALGERLLGNGVVCSENPPGTPVRPSGLMARNRIIVGGSHVLVVCEAQPGSGTMHSVWTALAEGRPIVVALPRPGSGPIPGSRVPALLADEDARGLLACTPPPAARRRIEELVAHGGRGASGVASDRDELATIITTLLEYAPPA